MSGYESYMTARRELLRMTHEIMLPEELGRMIADNLHSERGIRRMISYIKNAHPRSMEEIADEMIAIMEDEENWRQKKAVQESGSRYNAWLNSDLRGREE